jgi:hypothetical protein
MDPNEYAKTVYGLKPGDKVSPAMAAQIKEELSYYRKKKIDAMVKAEFDPEILNTQQGMYARYGGTNAVAIAPMVTNAQGQVVRGEPLRGYAADPYAAEAGAPAPLAGGGMMATNAPTAAPVQTPAPSPTPFPEGAVIRSKRDGKNYRIVNGQPVLVGP